MEKKETKISTIQYAELRNIKPQYIQKVCKKYHQATEKEWYIKKASLLLLPPVTEIEWLSFGKKTFYMLTVPIEWIAEKSKEIKS